LEPGCFNFGEPIGNRHRSGVIGRYDSMLASLFRFFSSLKLAVLCILSLAAVLGTATVLESIYGMRGAHVLVYGTWWFTGLLFLLGLNVLCAALSRYPWKRHQIGFVVTHAGILTILFGSFMTQQLGVDGNLPVAENTADNEVILNGLVLSVYDENNSLVREFEVPETATAREGKVMEIDFPGSSPEKIVVDKFFPRSISDRQVQKSPGGKLGSPAVEVTLYNRRFSLSEWLFNNRPGKPSELNLGPALLTVEKLGSKSDEQQFLSRVSEKPLVKKNDFGIIILQYQGMEFRLNIKDSLNQWKRLGSTQLEASIEKYFPYAVVKGNELTSKSDEPVNPAVQLTVREVDGRSEKHTVFANFPEFNTLHRVKAPTADSAPQFGLKFQMISGEGNNRAEMSIVGKNRGKLKFAVSPDDKKLYFRVISAAGTVNALGEVTPGAEQATGWMDLKFKISQWYPAALQEEVPRYIDSISGTDGNFMSAIRLTHVKAGAPKDAESRWLSEGRARSFNVAGQQLTFTYGKKRLLLPFQMFLKKFTIGTDPGTTKAASYESDVILKDRMKGTDVSARVSMNEPVKYGGYTFYQASYQIEEGKPPVSVFSVNYDPGRFVKYVGSIVMVLGVLLMFYMNPHYWNVVLGPKKEKKVA
jgi:hypothetical protein